MSCETDLTDKLIELTNKQKQLTDAQGAGDTLEHLREKGFVYGAVPMQYLNPRYSPAAYKLLNTQSTTAALDDASACYSIPHLYEIPSSFTDWVSTLSSIPSVLSSVSITGPTMTTAHGISGVGGTDLGSAGVVFIPVVLIFIGAVIPTVPAVPYSASFTLGKGVDCDGTEYVNTLNKSSNISPLLAYNTVFDNITIHTGLITFMTGNHARAQSGHGAITGSGSGTSKAKLAGMESALSITITR